MRKKKLKLHLPEKNTFKIIRKHVNMSRILYDFIKQNGISCPTFDVCQTGRSFKTSSAKHRRTLVQGNID